MGILYSTGEFVFFSAVNFIIFWLLCKKIIINFHKQDEIEIQKITVVEKLQKKLQYKRDFLLEKNEELLYQEELLNSKKTELERYCTKLKIELEDKMKTELMDFAKNCIREANPATKNMIRELLQNKLLETLEKHEQD